ATPLALKVPVVDYQIHTEHNKPYYKIIRVDGTHQLFLSFINLLRNFDREDLEMLWKIIQERFVSSEPKDFLDDFLLNALKTMFEKPNLYDVYTDLVFHDAPTVNEIVHTVEPSLTKRQIVLLPYLLKIGFLTQKMNLRLYDVYTDLVFHDAPTVNETVPTVEPSLTKRQIGLLPYLLKIRFLTQKMNLRPVEHHIPAKNLKKDIPKSRGHRHSWNRKACFFCKSLTHLIKDCDYYKKKMVQKLVRNNAMRGIHQHYARMTHLYPHRHVVPTSVLTRSRLVPLTAARPVTTAIPQTRLEAIDIAGIERHVLFVKV
nr:hypothetical protein [Tanacetum cinerariifolium]